MRFLFNFDTIRQTQTTVLKCRRASLATAEIWASGRSGSFDKTESDSLTTVGLHTGANGQFLSKIYVKYVGVQSWKAAHLPTLEIRVEQKGNRVMKCIVEIKLAKKERKKQRKMLDK